MKLLSQNAQVTTSKFSAFMNSQVPMKGLDEDKEPPGSNYVLSIRDPGNCVVRESNHASAVMEARRYAFCIAQWRHYKKTKGIDLVDLRDSPAKIKTNLNYDSDGLKDIRR
jgi:hypothetical protein